MPNGRPAYSEGGVIAILATIILTLAGIFILWLVSWRLAGWR